MTDPVQAVAAVDTKVTVFLAKQTAWVAANPKKALFFAVGAVVAAFVVGHVL